MKSTEGDDDFLKAIRKLSDVSAGVEPKRQEIIQDLISAKGVSFPAKLFHYTNSIGLCGIIDSNQLWATDFQSLNDSTELVHGAVLLVDELERYGNGSGGDISALLHKLSNFYREHGETFRSFNETYIISFSEAPDVLSQWRAYSDQAQGCCIEFDFSDSSLFTIINKNTSWALEILPVIYDEALQRKLIKSGIEKMLGYFDSTEWTVQKLVNSSEMEQEVVLGNLIHLFEPFLTAFKHAGFSEEKEWRAITSCVSIFAETNKRERTTASGKVNYKECLFVQGDEENLWQRDLLPITGIKHGPLADKKSMTANDGWIFPMPHH